MRNAIEPIITHYVPESGEKLIGHTPQGKPIYERSINKGKSVPLLDENGKEVWLLHPTTAQPLIPKRKLVPHTVTERFIPVDTGQGNHVRMPWHPHNEQEAAQAERRERVDQRMRSIAEALEENDIPTEALINLLKNGGADAFGPDEDGPRDEDDAPYPRAQAGGWYLLSNGEKIRGKDAAEAAEEALGGY